MTSDLEGSPNIVKEALACDLPIVSVDVGDVRQRLQGVHAAWITDRDPAALAAAVIEILRTCPRTNGSEKVQNLSLDMTSGALCHVYQKVGFSRGTQC
jgi:glycosyltransferase involved in cell wall biosynthesis